jgi:8-oxo-dGTP diphosphatase
MQKINIKYPIVGIRVLLFNEKNQILIGRRKDCGKFGLPGGKLEMYELPAEAAQREVLEETNLKLEKSSLKEIAIKNIISREQEAHFVNYYFAAKCDDEKIKELKNLEEDKCEGWGWEAATFLDDNKDELFFGFKIFLEHYNGAKDMFEQILRRL